MIAEESKPPGSSNGGMASERAPPGKSKGAIAVVDSDAAVRESFSVLLEGVGYLVRTYGSGVALLSSLPLFGPGCLLLEARRRNAEASRLLGRLSELGHELPTVLMANHPDAIPASHLLSSSVTSVLHKPIDEANLFGAIEHALSTDCIDGNDA
ncbi:MAG: response regulator transcription factor [Hyphomicrobiaceae bacterium]